MFGHLKPEDFVNLIEGGQLPANRKSHLDGCAPCSAKWSSISAMHGEVASLNTDDTDVPEPEWTEFRGAVRDQLLSRSVQRASAVRRWTGWSIRPATAWALSVFVAVALTTVAVLWNTERQSFPVGESEIRIVQPAVELNDIETVKTVWSPTALFDELIQLGEAEEEQLRQMLESAENRAPYRQ
jgi:hypothetical protein